MAVYLGTNKVNLFGGQPSGGGGSCMNFIVTLSYESNDDMWVPDCTYSDLYSAYQDGKEIAVVMDVPSSDASADGSFDDNDFIYWVRQFTDDITIIESAYVFNSNGVSLSDQYEYITPNYETVSKTYTPTTSQQTETVTYDSGSYNGLQEVNVTVNAVASGTAGTPTATKGTVSNHAIAVTPSVTNTTGYITGGTKTGTAVSVSASEVVSGDKAITANGNNIDVTEYATVSVNVSGGASNFVTGTFTTGSTTNTTGSFTINYTGTGYPIMLTIVVEGGAYNDTNSGNTTWYNSKQRYAIGFWSMTKARMTTAPTYTTSGADNYGVVSVIYKNSASTATTYTRNSTMNANTYSSSAGVANNTNTTAVRFPGNGKTVSYFIGYYTSSNAYAAGLAPNTTYRYYAVYSS